MPHLRLEHTIEISTNVQPVAFRLMTSDDASTGFNFWRTMKISYDNENIIKTIQYSSQNDVYSIYGGTSLLNNTWYPSTIPNDSFWVIDYPLDQSLTILYVDENGKILTKDKWTFMFGF